MYTLLIVISLQLLPNGVVIKTTEEVGPMLEKECLAMQLDVKNLADANDYNKKEVLSITCLTKGKA